jgi:hypothetical protein
MQIIYQFLPDFNQFELHFCPFFTTAYTNIYQFLLNSTKYLLQ